MPSLRARPPSRLSVSTSAGEQWPASEATLRRHAVMHAARRSAGAARLCRSLGLALEGPERERARAEASPAVRAWQLDGATTSSSLAADTRPANRRAPPRADCDHEPGQARRPRGFRLEGDLGASRRARLSLLSMRRDRRARGLQCATTTRRPAREKISAGHPPDRSYSATGICWLGRRAPGLEWSSSHLLESSSG